MTVKSILAECLTKMGTENFLNKTTLGADEQKLANRLLAALNVIYREVVTQYLPLYAEEVVSFENGRLKTQNLEKHILYPVAVYRDGQPCKLKAYNDTITCGFDGEARLVYAYLPETELKISDSIEDMRMSVSALSDGTLGEYYFENKVFDLAKSFDTDFRAKISMLKNKASRLCVKRRRWGA